MDQEDLCSLKQELSRIEREAQAGATVQTLAEMLKQVHNDFTNQSFSLERGIAVYRAVWWEKRPRYLGLLSYPPAEKILHMGRLNATGEAVFYSALDFGTCLLECGAKSGDTFVIGKWQTTRKALLQHLGYSTEIASTLDQDRVFAPVLLNPSGSARSDALRLWQSKVFTERVAKGSEKRYALTVALAKIFLGEIGNFEGFSAFSGLVYPSVAGLLASDNIAFTTDFADTLELKGAALVTVTDVNWGSSPGRPSTVNGRTIANATSYRGDGRLIWNDESTALSVTPFVSSAKRSTG